MAATLHRNRPSLLIVDDDPLIAESLSFVLGKGFAVRTATNRSDGIALLRAGPPPDAALIDLGLPPSPHRPDEGFALISAILALSPKTRIIVLSGQNDEAHARHARTLGATEFIAKPANPTLIKSLVDQVISFDDPPLADDGLRGSSAAIERLRTQIRQFADSPFPALIEGESGTGKEMVANGLHRQSRRKAKPFFAINCAAIAPSLVESTLFGHCKGAFTGATTAHAGFFEEASEGTLLLDEIGELPLEIQPKLLRVLENGEYLRIGETAARHSKARILAATNRDLRVDISEGRFRSDLYHRLSVLTISVPPLRERNGDAILLLQQFVATYAEQAQTGLPILSGDALARLRAYTFPGNVRELRNIAIRLCAKYPGVMVDVKELEAELEQDGTLSAHAAPTNLLSDAMETLLGQKDFNLEVQLLAVEAAYIQAAQQLAPGNLTQAARLLGINRTTLYNRLNVIARHRSPAVSVPDR